MPSMTFNSSLGYVGVLLLVAGIFLILTGLGIIRLEKITVTQGSKTWILGGFLIILGIVFLWPDIRTMLTSPIATPSIDETIGITPPVNEMLSLQTDPTDDWLTTSPRPNYMDIIETSIIKVDADNVQFIMKLNGTIPSSPANIQFYAWFLDTDLDNSTGQPHSGIGSDYNVQVTFFPDSGWKGQIFDIVNSSNAEIRSIKTDGTTVSIIIPLIAIGSPNKLNWVAYNQVGDEGYSDMVPNSGYIHTELLSSSSKIETPQSSVRPVAYTNYIFNNGTPFFNLDIYSTWEDAPSTGYVYPAFQFFFEANQGGYMGMQLVGESKKVIFSIWDIENGSAQPVDSGCARFDGEGTGAQCLIDYDWIPQREYRLRVWAGGHDENGENWVASIQDTITGVETGIGNIHLSNSKGFTGYGWLRGDVYTFLEYFGGKEGCEGHFYSRITWRGPYANNNQYIANSAYIPSYPNCAHNNVTTSGQPFVTHEGGGTITITTPADSTLWNTP